MAKLVKDLAASVHQRLLNLDPDRKDEFTARLTRFGLERLLYRLSKSEYADRFILKGAMLFVAWTGDPFRTTRDLDLLGLGRMGRDHLFEIFENICALDVEPDGLLYDASRLRITPIREAQVYQGWRVELYARMKNTKIRIQVDIGLGDVVIPTPEWIEYPTLLSDMPSPRIRAYRRETVLAEKLQTMVERGLTNSRMKDFYDIKTLGERFPFYGRDIVLSLRATFERRRVAIPIDVPTVFTEGFSQDPQKQIQWKAFLKRTGLVSERAAFRDEVIFVRDFLLPVLKAAARKIPFEKTWPPGGPWRKEG